MNKKVRNIVLGSIILSATAFFIIKRRSRNEEIVVDVKAIEPEEVLTEIDPETRQYIKLDFPAKKIEK